MSRDSGPGGYESREGVTLETFILEGMRGARGATGTFTSVMNQICLAAKVITSQVRRAGLANVLGYTGEINVQGERVQMLDELANQTMISTLRRRGHCAGIASEELDEAVYFDEATGHYLVLFDPLDGSSNIDVNMPIGTIFALLRFDRAKGKPVEADFLQPGSRLAAAGYVIYGSSTMLVLTTGEGVHAFTWDPSVGEFFLSRENIRCPETGTTYSVNEGNAQRWTPGVKRWNEYVKTPDEATGRPFTLRYVGTLVADAHRTLWRGGVFAYPADTTNKKGKLRLLYEANPLSLIFEAAGGAATDGRGNRILDVRPTGLHQRTPLVLGSKQDVELFEKFAREE